MTTQEGRPTSGGGVTGDGPCQGAGSPQPSGRSWWQRLIANRDARRAFACLIGFLVLAVMLGPEGSSTAPLSGVTGSLFTPRVLIFVGLGVATAAIMMAQARYGARIRQVSDGITAAPRRLLPDRRTRYGLYAGALVLAVVVPMHISGYWQGVLVQQIGIYVLLALGLNVVVGFAGLLDLGYVAFYAIGAYTAAYWSGALPVHPPITLNMFWIIPFAILAAMLAGVLLGAPTLRLRGRLPRHRDARVWRDHRDRGHQPGRVYWRRTRRPRHPPFPFQPARAPLLLGHCPAPLLLPPARFRGPEHAGVLVPG